LKRNNHHELLAAGSMILDGIKFRILFGTGQQLSLERLFHNFTFRGFALGNYLILVCITLRKFLARGNRNPIFHYSNSRGAVNVF